MSIFAVLDNLLPMIHGKAVDPGEHYPHRLVQKTSALFSYSLAQFNMFILLHVPPHGILLSFQSSSSYPTRNMQICPCRFEFCDYGILKDYIKNDTLPFWTLLQ